MKFILEINLGNEAMQTAWNIGEALEAIAHSLRFAHDQNGGALPENWDEYDRSGQIKDANGNKVGRWELKQDFIRRSRAERIQAHKAVSANATPGSREYNQQMGAFALIAALQDAGLRPRSYSGRGMFGKECVGVSADSAFDVFNALKTACARGTIDAHIEEPEQDQLGKRSIFYWPKLAWPKSHTV